jgi:hypothetical protein
VEAASLSPTGSTARTKAANDNIVQVADKKTKGRRGKKSAGGRAPS